jgi:AcrR family transcriptional regulator
MDTTLDASGGDGRWLRSLRTRAAIVDAWLELTAEGDLAPTAKDVAERAGIGLRTVFQHFSDMSTLHCAAAEELIQRVDATVPEIPDGLSVRERIAFLVERRGEFFDAMANMRRSSERQEWSSPAIREMVESWEQRDAESIAVLFANEIDDVPADQRAAVAIAIDAAGSWSHWHHLRHRRGLGADVARGVVAHALEALLAPCLEPAVGD